MLQRYETIFTSETILLRGNQLVVLEVPADAQVSFFGSHLIVRLRTDWLGFSGGSLIAASLEAFLGGARDFAVLFTPTPTRALSDWAQTRDALVLTVLDNVRTRLEVLNFDGAWQKRDLNLPVNGTANAAPLEINDTGNTVLVTVTDYLTPNTLLSIDLSAHDALETLKSSAQFFDASDLETQSLEAISADGTRIPYTVVARKGLALSAANPTLLYGYGGFEVSELPSYRAGVGIGWLEAGGVYVVANIRGGGEFGPSWHSSALKENRQRCFDDFIAVAEDLIRRGITSSHHLGINGGSNGGLLVGAVMTQRPELFAAVVCQVPLLDMRRYHLLLAGASWMAEYGDPDQPEEWAYISRYSPYQNLKPGVSYPPVLFTTSTRDDRVHPGHARKMAARMLEDGQGVLLYENIEGGHAGAADNAQAAQMAALMYRFLWQKLGGTN